METSIASADPLVLQIAAGFALCAIACGLIMAGRMSIRRAADSEKWPTVEGCVLESTVASARDGRRQTFHPVVRYRYEIDGSRYEGSRIRWDASEGFRKFTRARRMLDAYRPGSAIKVHYDPRQPAVAVLQPRYNSGLRPAYLIAPAAAMSVLLVVGCTMVGS